MELTEFTDLADAPLDETLEQKHSLTGRLKDTIMYAAALSVSEKGMYRPLLPITHGWGLQLSSHSHEQLPRHQPSRV